MYTAIGNATLQAQGHESVLHHFPYGPFGAYPHAGVVGDPVGNLYGTTFNGGPSAAGVVYKVSPSGRETVLYSFTGGLDGYLPEAGVTRDAQGNLYGTTYRGGNADQGVVYKLDPTGKETVLHSFTGGADGSNPQAGVVLDGNGNAYGTTAYGGAHNQGVIYKLNAAGNETVLYVFTGGADGGTPLAPVLRDSAGKLYGTTSHGGQVNAGAIYRLDPSGHETVLYSFVGGSDGYNPSAGVIHDPAGNLYGTSIGGQDGGGVIYKLDTSGQFTTLHSFTGGSDGQDPTGGIVRDSGGNLYGTTNEGGTGIWGIVYKLDPSGNETILHNFSGNPDGSLPVGGVIIDGAGNLYGSTSEGGVNLGTVFKISPGGQETVIYRFAGGADGTFPKAGVIRDASGNLYGTTYYGGPANAGVVYSLSASGHQRALYTFTGGADGKYPAAGVVRDSRGNLYGTTAYGGSAGVGVVFKVDPSGSETVLHSFTGGADGANPNAGVILDSNGNIYGTASQGGLYNAGVVFKLDSAGTETVLYTFQGSQNGFLDGTAPQSNLIRDSQGNLYGTAGGGAQFQGVVYKLDPAGNETVLCALGYPASYPNSGVIRDSAGNLYGVAGEAVYKVDPAGNLGVLYTFTGAGDGGTPYGGVIRDSAGNLYGTTYYGGSAGSGVVYKLSPSAHETVLHNFTGGVDGGYPYAGVIRDSAGNLYGTTSSGGLGTGGVVYKLSPP